MLRPEVDLHSAILYRKQVLKSGATQPGQLASGTRIDHQAADESVDLSSFHGVAP
jgi:hypothetical protein